MTDTTDKQKVQVEIAERLQLALLKDFERQLLDGTISSTDRATLARLLTQNGWSLDPSRLPKGLKDQLTSRIDPEDLDEDDDVLPLRRQA
jgi:hypothetical protein